MAGTRKGPKVKRLERIAELFAGKPQQALAAAVDVDSAGDQRPGLAARSHAA